MAGSASGQATQQRLPPWEARCHACGGWVGTVPAGTPWFRGRCINRRCRMYGKTEKFRSPSSSA